jgi:hypothetical protein
MLVAAVSAGVAVGVLGESSLREEHKILSKKDNYPIMPDSVLVLEYREDISKPLLEAMTNALKRAFGKI